MKNGLHVERLRGCLAALSAGVITLSLGACASAPDAAHPLSAGWRMAHIDHEVGLDESVPMLVFDQDCRFESATPSPSWVLLHYRDPTGQLSGDLYRVVPLPESVRLKPDEEVYVNVNHCNVPLVPRFPLPSHP